ncbi:MAG TPA: hypothetical protein VJ487_13960 [Alphaproteobacteria bacterium]|nr:hypothetical protein [Alphaproteobacteria bacterium]
MAKLMSPADFEKMFTAALTDKQFQNDLLTKGFKALDERGYDHGVPAAMQKSLQDAISSTPGVFLRPRCGVCGLCGLCGLCAEVNFGSASAALWALAGIL